MYRNERLNDFGGLCEAFCRIDGYGIPATSLKSPLCGSVVAARIGTSDILPVISENQSAARSVVCAKCNISTTEVMFSMPSRRHYLPFLLVLIATLVFFRFLKYLSSEQAHNLLTRSFESQLDYGVEIPPELLQDYFDTGTGYSANELIFDNGIDENRGSSIALHPHLSRLLTCPIRANPHTDHIRIPVLSTYHIAAGV